jgi:hypothetical protein
MLPGSRTNNLHEAFQRIIFDFIVKNIEKAFMREEISLTRRQKEEGGGMAPVYMDTGNSWSEEQPCGDGWG